MMHKVFLCVICFIGFLCYPTLAQKDTSAAPPSYSHSRLTLMVGLQDHFSFIELRSVLIGAVIILPRGKWHLGVQAHLLPRGRVEPSSYFELQKGSFDLGFYGERVFNFRFFRKKLPFYIGSEVRLGVRRYWDRYVDLRTFREIYLTYPGHTFKLLARPGIKYQWENAVLDILLPAGMEFERIKRPIPSSSENHYDYYGYFESDRPRMPVFLPSISLGYTF